MVNVRVWDSFAPLAAVTCVILEVGESPQLVWFRNR
jgi:hypothetical protein